MSFEHRGGRKRRRRMSGREGTAFARWSITSDGNLDALCQSLRHDNRAKHVEAKLRDFVGPWLVFGRRQHISSDDVQTRCDTYLRVHRADVLARGEEPCGRLRARQSRIEVIVSGMDRGGCASAHRKNDPRRTSSWKRGEVFAGFNCERFEARVRAFRWVLLLT